MEYSKRNIGIYSQFGMFVCHCEEALTDAMTDSTQEAKEGLT